MGSIARTTEPYGAAMKKDWERFKTFYTEYEDLIFSPLTITKDTALHFAVYSENTKLLKDLIEIAKKGPMFEFAFMMTNVYGNTPLHEATAAGNLEALQELVDFNGQLLTLRNNLGETSLFRAAAFGRTDMIRAFSSELSSKIHHSRNDGTTILHIAVIGKYFGTALELLKQDPTLGVSKDGYGATCLQLLAQMPSAFKSGYPMGLLKRLVYFCLPVDVDDYKADETQVPSSQEKDLECGRGKICSGQFNYLNKHTAISRMYYTIWNCIGQEFPAIRELQSTKKKQTEVLMLAKELAKMDLTWRVVDFSTFGGEVISLSKDNEDDIDVEDVDQLPKPKDDVPQPHPSSPTETPLIAAARHGIIEIVKAILEVYPPAIEHVNKDHENIFHVATKNRRKEILDLLQYSHIPISRLSREINIEGNSILHQAAYQGESQLRERPGEALQMQSDIQWFKRVKKIVPPYFINHRNNDKLTADELFTKEHKKLMEGGQEWLMRTTEACTIVAVLIATVAFTSAYTIPGGPNSKTGHPLLLKTTPFLIFTVSDTLSLCFALTSVVVFLSILTSRMHEQEFRMSLPLKLVIGLTTLFFAVASMMVAFAATLVLMIRQRLHWAAIPIYTVACCPVTIFLAIQFPLYLNIAWFTVRDVLHGFIDSLPHRKRMTKTYTH